MAAQDYIPNTTLTNAITATQTSFKVASASAILDTNILVIDGEVCEIGQVDTTNNILNNVRRGCLGTAAAPHAASARVFYAAGSRFQALAVSAPGFLGNGFPCPIPGSRATDGAGNVWVLVDLTATCYDRTTVVISGDGNYTATQAAGGAQGAVGVTLEKGTSDQWVWAQIYGYTLAQETVGDSAGTSALLAVAATTPSTPSVGLATIAFSSVGAYYIQGMFITGIPTTATTSATSSTGVRYPVFLNYPWATANRTDYSSL